MRPRLSGSAAAGLRIEASQSSARAHRRGGVRNWPPRWPGPPCGTAGASCRAWHRASTPPLTAGHSEPADRRSLSWAPASMPSKTPNSAERSSPVAAVSCRYCATTTPATTRPAPPGQASGPRGARGGRGGGLPAVRDVRDRGPRPCPGSTSRRGHATAGAGDGDERGGQPAAARWRRGRTPGHRGPRGSGRRRALGDRRSGRPASTGAGIVVHEQPEEVGVDVTAVM